MKQRSTGGCGSFILLLFLFFVVLKVTGLVDWSWWWVASPLWLPAVFVLGTLAVMAVMGVSVYRIVVGAPKRQERGGAARPESGTTNGEVLDAEGKEVRRGSPEKRPPAGLPAPGSDSDVEEGPRPSS